MSFSRDYSKYLDIMDFLPECRNLLSDYLCFLCTGVYHNPVMDSCGHIFCIECIKKHLEKKKSCPILNEANIDIKPINIVSQVLEKQKIYCKNRIVGCDFVGKLNELQPHLDQECKRHCIKCKNFGCDKKFLREDLEIHLEHCEFRSISCVYCSKEILYCENEIHLNVCNKIPINCINKCGDVVERMLMDIHVFKHCGYAIVDCEYKSVGCLEQIFRKDVDDHMLVSLDRHNLLLICALDAFERKWTHKFEKLFEEKVKKYLKYNNTRDAFHDESIYFNKNK